MLSALAVAATGLLLQSPVQASERNLPMRFDMLRQSAADSCGKQCRGWITASGAITADTPQDFKTFAKGRDLAGATLALDSDGGSVHGAIELGRAIRRLGLDTTVGRAIAPSADDTARPKLSPQADCESMCAFVLLAGVHRTVPPEARVMVHQIWLGDRRDDPTAANYSAQDLVLVQRDIGSLAQYTVDMGGSIALLDLALRIPPWEPMHRLSRAEIRKMHVDDSSEPAAPIVPAAAAEDARTTAISERKWAMVDHAGSAVLARRAPLTIEGEEIGSFDLVVSCGGAGSYDVSYSEQRHSSEEYPLPPAVTGVTLTLGKTSAEFKLLSSKRQADTDELVTLASATLPDSLIGGFAAAGNHSMTIETSSAIVGTGIRLGNTGALANLPRLAASCKKSIGDRADLATPGTGGLAAAK
jgi:hypothetical protein